MNCLEFVIILLPVPKVNKLSVLIFVKKKRDFTTYEGKKKFSTEEKCYLMGWGEYGVKSEDIVARVGPSQRAKHVEDAEGEHLHHLPPHDDIKFFWLQGLFKNYFALEPLLKLATFVVKEVIFQNVKKKVKKIFPRHCNRRRQKKGPKNRKFFSK